MSLISSWYTLIYIWMYTWKGQKSGLWVLFLSCVCKKNVIAKILKTQVFLCKNGELRCELVLYTFCSKGGEACPKNIENSCHNLFMHTNMQKKTFAPSPKLSQQKKTFEKNWCPYICTKHSADKETFIFSFFLNKQIRENNEMYFYSESTYQWQKKTVCEYISQFHYTFF